MQHLTACSVVDDFKGNKKLTEPVKDSRLDSYRLIKRTSSKFRAPFKAEVKEVRDNWNLHQSFLLISLPYLNYIDTVYMGVSSAIIELQ